MMMYEGDLRRCRRCKRKRMDDEPPEVQQYKTCAKCRIIERTKKKLRKPLAEETMRYGMRQFQEQNQNANFIHDDVFTADQLLSDIQANRDAGLVNPSKQLYNAQFSVYKQPNSAGQGYNQQQYGQQGLNQGMGAASPNYNYAQNYSYNGGQLGMSPGYPGASVGLSAYQLPLMGNASPYINNPVAIANAATGGVLSSVGPNASGMSNNGRNLQQLGATSTATAAQIAAAAINRPDAQIGQPGFKLQQQYYRHYQQKQGDRSRIAAPTSCELCSSPLDLEDSVSTVYRLCNDCYSNPYSRPHVYSDFNDFLLAMSNDSAEGSFTYISELASYLVESLNSNKPITSEQQFRKTMLDSFRLIYLDPLFASLSPAKLTQTSNNISELNNTVPIVSKVSQQNHYLLTPPLKQTFATADSSTSVELLFVTETNLIIIKKIAKKAQSEFSDSFLKSLDNKMRSRGLSFEDDASKVYSDLGLTVDADQFAKNFKSFEKLINQLRGTGSVKETTPSQNGVNDKKASESDQSDREANESDQAQDSESADLGKDHLDDGAKSEANGQEELADNADPKEVDPAFGA
ncbi:hypothetical protein C7M61_003693 [Candidozyma pseudohaemuli]|uniref:Uncharacterized protein n=1 Tax=Candidozyma pseudohaemuli TaxID=418784 RepID=A0A2P7YLJ8_9ASCO|nr:hypothetical protein C7M61_003693 [[Candida] pseudohaemulonii]PSK36829.1 hypothetical protein C7M61_003693 [[Candida] pseudohaemulonii]